MIVLKVGGAALKANRFEADFFGGSFCVVHGAGPQISLEMERAGIPVEFVDGRRVTSTARSSTRSAPTTRANCSREVRSRAASSRSCTRR